jgi:MFS family permease
MTITSPNPAASRRITAALFTAQSLFSASLIASFTVSAIVAVQLSGSETAAGAPTTLTLLGRAAFAYPIGWLMDRFGRRSSLSLGYLTGTIGAAISVVSIIYLSYWGFLLGALLFGAARGAGEQSRFVAAEVQPLSRRAKAMGLIVFAGTIGAIGGPRLVVPSERLATLWQFDPLTGVFAISTLLLFVATLVTLIMLRPDPLTIALQWQQAEAPHQEGQPREAMPATPLSHIFSRPLVQLAVSAMLVSQLTMTLLMVITPLHMYQHHHSTGAIANVIMAHTLGMFGLSSVTGWLIDRLGRIPMIAIGALTMILSGVLTPLSADFWPLALTLFLLGLGWNFCFIAGSALLSEGLVAHERGRVQGTAEMLVALGSGAGSLGTGYLFAFGNMPAVAVVGTLPVVALFLLALWARSIGQRVAPAAGHGD